MSDDIIQLNEAAIKGELKNLVRNSVEETLNALLDHEVDELVSAEKMNALETARAIAPAIMTGILQRHLAMYSCMFQN